MHSYFTNYNLKLQFFSNTLSNLCCMIKINEKKDWLIYNLFHIFHRCCCINQNQSIVHECQKMEKIISRVIKNRCNIEVSNEEKNYK